MERICRGVATKPQALKGEFRVKPNLLNLNNYKKLNAIFIDNKEYSVDKVIIRDTFVIFKVKDINSCEEAETIRNKEIYADMELGDKSEDNSTYISYNLLIDGKSFATIKDVNNFGSKDIVSFVGEKSGMFPVIDGLFINVNNDNKTVELNKELLEQVVVYED